MSRHRTGFFTVPRLARLLVAALIATFTVFPTATASASVSPTFTTPHFGDGNIPPGCENDMDPSKPEWWPVGGGGLTTDAWSNSTAVCHHQRTDMNYLDSPKIDVLVMVPATEPERSLRVARQSLEMWEAGIDFLAADMGMQWLADGVDFHIAVDQVDVGEADGDGEFTTYPIVDPEIVVVMGVNPTGTLGIGITPVSQNLCYGVKNPFDIDTWENLPGFDSHHETRGGIYNEDCNGAGGDVCFAVNTTMDTSVFGWDSMFDLVAHEVGHCLSIGHVGDGAEGGWGGLPPDDIMAYSDGVAGTSCVSTLNVESIALRMSRYLDVNDDGVVTAADRLVANDATGGGHKNDNDPFQVMHPRDYHFASRSGKAIDCPQPDLGLVPGERTQWTPVVPNAALLSVTGPEEGAENQDGVFDVTGTVSRFAADPTATSGSWDDADDDATTPITEILDFDVEVTDTHVEATIALEALYPVTDGMSPATYTLVVDDWEMDSLVYGVGFGTARGYDDNGFHNDGFTAWDTTAGTVSFTIPRSYLSSVGVTAPYQIRAEANLGSPLALKSLDDQAPDAKGTIGLAAPASATLSLDIPLADRVQTQTFERPEGNTFYTESSALGIYGIFGLDDPNVHTFDLALPTLSDVEFTMTWTNGLGTGDLDDLDLYVTGAADSGSQGATAAQPEVVSLTDVQGALVIAVEPYLVTDGVFGTTYVLTAEITPSQQLDTDGDSIPDATDQCPTEFGVAPTGCPDADADGIPDATDQCPQRAGVAPTGCPDGDGDGVIDDLDQCPTVFGAGADGCPIVVTEQVRVFVDGLIEASEPVDTTSGPDDFAMSIDVSEGTHVVTIEWSEGANVLASATRTIIHTTDDDGDGIDNADDICPGFDDTVDLDGDGRPDGCDPDVDGDTIANADDNCPTVANAGQADLDGDGIGDDCDADIDGDGVTNGADLCPGHDDNVDVDRDGIPDGCDGEIEADTDGDGILDSSDNCLNVVNADQNDLDGDGIGDACDGDVDGDGVPNEADLCHGFDDAIDVNGNGEPDGCETDTLGPTITYSIRQIATPSGWYRSNVRVDFSCSDDLSEVVDCPAYYVFTEDGAGQSTSVTVHDSAGNASTVEITGVNIDRADPTVAVDGDGLTTSAKVITGTATDNASGVDRIKVTFASVDGMTKITRWANLACATVTSCTWSVVIPSKDVWRMTAVVFDVAGYKAEPVKWNHIPPMSQVPALL